jgi:hypothetical protein
MVAFKTLHPTSINFQNGPDLSPTLFHLSRKARYSTQCICFQKAIKITRLMISTINQSVILQAILCCAEYSAMQKY